MRLPPDPIKPDRTEYVIPQRCADAVISSAKSMMALVMHEEGNGNLSGP